MAKPAVPTSKQRPGYGEEPSIDRRSLIARCAIDVVAEHGVEGLTHRRVAAAAKVPLGSTTYYFDTLDDLLEAALAAAKVESDAEMRRWIDALPADADLAAELAVFLVSLADRPARAIVEQELYLAALRRPALRALSTAWSDSWQRILAERTDESTAAAITATAIGYSILAVTHDRPPSREQIEPTLRRLLQFPGSGQPRA